MKNFKFKIEVLPDANVKVRKKHFTLELDDDIHPYDMFEEAKCYVQENAFDVFDLYSTDDYFPFKISRGKKVVLCDLEYEHCHCCGGEVDIYGEYEGSEGE